MEPLPPSNSATNRTPWIIAGILAVIAIVAVTLLVSRESEDNNNFPFPTAGSSFDFREAAEETIQDEIAKQIDGTASAECESPDSTKVGTTFDCTGIAGDGSTSIWSAEITSEKVVTVSFVGIGDPAEDTEETEETTGS